MINFCFDISPKTKSEGFLSDTNQTMTVTQSGVKISFDIKIIFNQTVYEVLSGNAGVKRDWNRLRSLFIPEGRMIPINPKREGGFAPRVMSVDGYIELSGDYIEKNGFFESEISREIERFGNLVHCFGCTAGAGSSCGGVVVN